MWLYAAFVSVFVVCGPRLWAFLSNGLPNSTNSCAAQQLWFHYMPTYSLLCRMYIGLIIFACPLSFAVGDSVFVSVYSSVVNRTLSGSLVYRESLPLANVFVNSQSTFAMDSTACAQLMALVAATIKCWNSVLHTLGTIIIQSWIVLLPKSIQNCTCSKNSVKDTSYKALNTYWSHIIISIILYRGNCYIILSLELATRWTHHFLQVSASDCITNSRSTHWYTLAYIGIH